MRLDSALLLRGPAGQAAHARWIELLAALGSRRSIVAAAKSVGLSYKAAWDAIETLNNLSDQPLVERLVGGRGGGGTRLTPAGAALVRVFRRAQRENARFLRRLNRDSSQPDAAAAQSSRTLGRLALKTSARNQFAGSITRITRGVVDTEVQIRLGRGEQLVAVITRTSAARLNLRRGMTVMAWIKASSVILVADADTGAQLSARNVLRGTVTRVVRSAVNCEVVLEFGGGSTIAATVTQASVRALALKRGTPVTAVFKASSVILVTEA